MAEKIPLQIEDLGEPTLKGIEQRVHVFRVRLLAPERPESLRFEDLKVIGGSAEEVLNQAADDLLRIAQRAAEAVARRGDAIDETLMQIRALLAKHPVGPVQ